MGKQFIYIWCFLIVTCCKHLLNGYAAKSPQYTVLRSQPDYEIRLYKESSWMSAIVQGPNSFEKATKDGFHRLYRYIHGSNLDSSRLCMTSPVLTSILSPSNKMNYSIKYYLSGKDESMPPQPSPELHLQVDNLKSRCIAIRKFSGFAKDDTIDDQVQALLNKLHKNTTQSYTIAQYNAPHHRSERLNEVWIDVSAEDLHGCPWE